MSHSPRLLAALAVTGLAVLPVALATPASAAPAATEKIVIQPFAADGTLKAGWDVKTFDEPLDCSTADASVGGVTADTYHCGGTVFAAYACVADPLVKNDVLCFIGNDKLLRYHTTGLSHTDAPAKPIPLQIEYTNGDRCQIHAGGAWTAPIPDAYAAYACSGEGITEFVLGDQDTHRIFDTSAALWTVKSGSGNQGPDGTFEHSFTRQVAKVWYLGAFESKTPATTKPSPTGTATKPATKAPSSTATPTKPSRGVAAHTGVEDADPALLLGAAAAVGGLASLALRKRA